jgi:hypothetical protein
VAGRQQANLISGAEFRPELVIRATHGGQIMLRKMVIALAAAAALTAGSMIPVSAHDGGHGGGGGGGMGHGGGMSMGHGGGGMSMGHGGFGHAGFAGFAHHGDFQDHDGRFASHRFHDGDDRFAFRHHHRFFFNRFAFYGSGYPYDDGCYRHVWSRWGWRWVSVCN